MTPRRATSVTTPAISPASMCFCIAGPMRASRSDESPTSSGVAFGSEPARVAAGQAAARMARPPTSAAVSLGTIDMGSPLGFVSRHGNAAPAIGSRRALLLAKLVTAPHETTYAFSQPFTGGIRHETLVAAFVDRRLLRRRRDSALRRGARLRGDRVCRPREA